LEAKTMTAIATTAVISAIAIAGEVKNGEDIFICLGTKMNSLSKIRLVVVHL
jgi:hypothetical protein